MPESSNRLKKAEQAVADQPQSARAHIKLGMVLHGMGAVGKAEQAFERALELDDQCAEAMVNLGGIYVERLDFAKSVELNRRAGELKPELMHAHFNQGVCHLYLSQPEQMVPCFEKVLALEPNHAGAHYYLAVGLYGAGRVAEARQSLNTAMELGYSPEPDLLKALERENGMGVFAKDSKPKVSKDSDK